MFRLSSRVSVPTNGLVRVNQKQVIRSVDQIQNRPLNTYNIFQTRPFRLIFQISPISSTRTMVMYRSRWPLIEKGNERKAKPGKGKSKGKDKDEDEDDSPQIEIDLEDIKRQCNLPIDALRKEYEGIRVTRISPMLLDRLTVVSPDGSVPMTQVGQVSVKDAQTLIITLFEASQSKYVEKAIRDSNLQLTPTSTKANVIEVKSPKITTEHRENMKKLANSAAEKAKVGVRGARKNAMDLLKSAKLPKDAERRKEKEIQDIIDQATNTIQQTCDAKLKEISI